MPVRSFPSVVTHHDGASHTLRRRTRITDTGDVARRVNADDDRAGVGGAWHRGRPRLHELLYEYRPKLNAAGQPIYLAPALRHSGDAANVLVSVLAYQAVELFGVLCLSARHQVLCWHLVARGWLDGAWVDPRLIFQAAFVVNADTIILAHNHPGGDPLPSVPDMDLTRRMIAIGDVLGVHVLDHIVIGDGAFASIRRTNAVSQT